MKKVFTFLICSLFTIHSSLAQQYGWIDISANIPGDSLYHDLSDVFFVSDEEGWITSSSHAEIYHTTDGGETFEIQTTQYACNAIFMINNSTGYAGGENGRVYRTVDGGENWIAIGTIGSTLTDMDFATDAQGYACGDGGAVFSITPNEVINLNIGSGIYWKGISAPTVDNVWLCGSTGIYHYNGTSITEQPSPTGSFNAISMLSNESGWVAGNIGSPSDGSGLIAGYNGVDIAWTVHNDILQYKEPLFAIFSLTPSELWTVGVDGVILHTGNGDDYDIGWSNVIWEQQAEGLTSNFLRGVYFTSSANGYVVGNNRTLLKYTEVSEISDIAQNFEYLISPNPAKNWFKVQSSRFKVGGATLELYDLGGRNLIKKQIPPWCENFEVDVRGLESGLYFFQLTVDNRSSTQKIIIQK